MATNIYTDIGMPVQKIPLSKKDEAWGINCVDSQINKGEIYDLEYKRKMYINYDLFNGRFDESDLHYVTNPFGVDVNKESFPANMTNINHVYTKVNLLVGEESQQPFNWTVMQTNSGIASKLEEAKKKAYERYAQEEIINAIMPEMLSEEKQETPEDIAERLKTWTDKGEEAAQTILQYQYKNLNMDEVLLNGWKDGLISGEEIYFCGSVANDVKFERCNPLYASYDRTPLNDVIEDGSWFRYEMRMTTAQIYDRFKDLMTEKDLDTLLTYSGVNSYSPNTLGTMYTRRTIEDRNYVFQVSSELISVYHVLWTSYSKLGILKYEEEGEIFETVVDENYKPNEGDDITWEWLPEIWEGYRIGADIYIGIQPTDYERLPYIGGRYNATNSDSVSLVDILKPLQYFYNIAWYRMELAMARDKGKVLVMDMTQIPKSLGFDLNRWLHYTSALGITLINPYEEGFDVNRDGKPSTYNQFTAVDLSQAQAINQYIGLLDFIDAQMGSICGITKQREGSIKASEGVGNVRASNASSASITEPLFRKHRDIKRKAMTAVLETTKFAWRDDYKNKEVYFVLPDGQRKWLDSVPDDFMFGEHDIFVSDSMMDIQNIQLMKDISKQAIQNGTPLSDIGKMLTMTNMNQIVNMLKVGEELSAKAKSESEKAKYEGDQKSQEMQMQVMAEKNRIEEEDSIRKSDTAIAVAEINATKSKDAGTEVMHENTQQKLELEREKLNRKENFQNKQLDETKRSNMKKEELTQEKIKKQMTGGNKKQ